MRKWIGSIAAATLGFGLSASAWACNTSSGEVLQINTDARTVAMSKGGESCCPTEANSKANQMVFKLKKDTKVLINGKEATLADLKKGDKVKVDYESMDDVLKISVTRDT